MIKKFFIFGGLTLCSRVLGLIRDLLIATHLGAGMFADVFFVAFRLPNLFRALFAEGALSSSFIPIYLGMEQHLRKQFVSNLFFILASILVIFCFCMQSFMPYAVTVLSPGFVADGIKFDYTIFFARVMFPYLFFISLVALMGALLNAHNRVAAFAASPIILNLCLILGVLLFKDYFASAADALSYSVLIAGILQFIWMLLNLRMQGIQLGLGSWQFTTEVKAFLGRFFPALFGMGIAQISIFVDTIFASIFAGAVSYFYYSERLIQLPLAVVGVALSTAILPDLANKLKAGDREGAIDMQNRALAVILFAITPAAAALYTLAFEISSCVYFYGAFNRESLNNTAEVLKVFAFALPAFVLNKVFSNVFFAIQDTKTPAKYSGFALLLNVVLNLILFSHYQYLGIAWATVVSAWFNFLLIIRTLIKKTLYEFDQSAVKYFFYVFLATSVMILVTQMLDVFLYRLFLTSYWPIKLTAGFVMALAGSASYLGAFALLRKFSPIHKHSARNTTSGSISTPS